MPLRQWPSYYLRQAYSFFQIMFTGLLRGQFKISMAAVGHHSGAVVSIAIQQEGCELKTLSRGLFLRGACMFSLRWCEFYFKESYSTHVKDGHARQICNCVTESVKGCLSPCGPAIKCRLVQDVPCLHPKTVGMEASTPVTRRAGDGSWKMDKWLQLGVHTM